ncbi:MAG: SusD/RagB family nutrient-binding outer membrane lipoprotein [Flavobacteriia bacterium]|nr:SusD/RagB family nutrient-binding outer membrane lipoprotein [Flavobacteriia bacterium]
MKINKLIAVIMIGLVSFTSCETTELELVDNPNALSPSQADATFFLNSIQVDFAFWVNTMGTRSSNLTRIGQLSGRNYAQVYNPATFDGVWRNAYQGLMEDVRLMTPLAEESGLTTHLGMAQVLKAYVLITLVDHFGNVPYTEALLGADNLSPNADSGDVVYAAALEMLDAAVVNLNAGGPSPSVDLFYSGDASKWVKAANSIKKKIHFTTGNASAFNAITDYIKTEADDFQFQWGTNEVQPDTRHPSYRSSYTATGGGTYMSNWLMNNMLTGHGGTKDPRMAYYFYRQVSGTPGFGGEPANEETLECGLQTAPFHYLASNEVFCGLNDGYWGRDHGNSDGIPPDGFLRTLHGVYPAGGTFDDRSFDGQVNGDGLGGKGITPVLLSSWMDFMDAYMNPANMRTATLAGAKKSIEKADSVGGPAMDAADVDAYVALIAADYDAASTADKAELWAEQFWISMYGNGIDAYNTYRKTGLPANLQPNIEPEPGAFPLVMYYPANYANTNANVSQRNDLTERVFWNTSGPSNLK